MSDIKKVIGIFTTKGGVGKTTLALNISYLLSKSLLVEMDRNQTLTATLKMEIVPVEEFLKSGKISKVGELGFISVNGKVAPSEWEEISSQAGERFRYVVFDFHNAITQDILPPLQRADITLIPAIPSMEGLGAYIHTKKNLEAIGIKHLGVANMVHKSLFGIAKEEREILEKMRSKGEFWEGYIPYDRNVVRAGISHKVAVAEYPNSQFGKAIKNLVEVIK